jgi:zona occludens toxin (predicted ATPase)
MSETERQDKEAAKWQKLFDNIWLLFVLSLVISTLIYNVWGIYDLLHVPPAP